MLYSKEGQQAANTGTGYHHAISHYYDINEAVATVSPYLVSVLAYGTDFLYHQGILCYCTGQELRLLDVHQAGQTERVVNFHSILWRLVPSLKGFDPTQSVKLVHYCDDALAFRVLSDTNIEGSMDILFAMDVAYRHGTSRRKRLLLRAEAPTGAPIFVRGDRSCIWYGYSTIANSNEGGPWQIHAIDLLSNQTIDYPIDRRLQGDLGETVCFEVYDETLYAVSTVEKSDDTPSKTSFYYWFCYIQRQDQSYCGQLWRRENREGPIDDSWTNLSMRLDEVTSRPVIVECRREWHGGKSESRRTCYIGPLPTLGEAVERASNFSWSHLDPVKTIPEIFSEYPNQRPCQSYHTEFNHAYDQDSRREFTTARTKFHTYHLSAATFLDLVNDPLTEEESKSRDFFRIRAISKRLRRPIDDENGAGLLFKTRTDVDCRTIHGSEERFIGQGVRLWPSKDSRSLTTLLCTDTQKGTVSAISDERSMIYSMPSPGLQPGHQYLVLISFDPKMNFINALTRRTSEHPETLSDAPFKNSSSGSLISVERPLYKTIRKGHWLR